jgi:Subtilase family
MRYTGGALLLLASCMCMGTLALQEMAGAMAQPNLAPVYNEKSLARIPGRFIVIFKADTPADAVIAAGERIKALGGTVLFTYQTGTPGFVVTVPIEGPQAQSALQALRTLPGIDYVEADQAGKLQTIQNNPPKGLNRIDRRGLPLDTTFTYTETGKGVDVYVLDTGIASHPDYAGRFTSDYSVAGTSYLDDCYGHGTHVAGTIGGTKFGVAKEVSLHSVRIIDAACNVQVIPSSLLAAGVRWVTAQHLAKPSPRPPAVANVSLVFPAGSVTLEDDVKLSIAAGVTYVVAAGNGKQVGMALVEDDACNWSPANVTEAITVGATDPDTDTRVPVTNFGPCIDLFAPGSGIESAMPSGLPPVCPPASPTSMTCLGTSMAAPHVAGCAALYLQNHLTATPPQVWAGLLAAANVSGTMVGGTPWPGILGAGTGSQNRLLHCGSSNDLMDDGDPHLTTADGIHYDFQSAGEFVAIRDGNGMEIQTRKTAITTQPPIANPYTGLATCVSLNTAIATRVGLHRITYQPNLNSDSRNGGMQVRVDGVLTALGAQGVNLGPGARVTRSSIGNGIDIDFPDGTSLSAIASFWGAPHNVWFLNVSIFGTPASEGLLGPLASGSWLPALPNGSSLGPMPGALHQRYEDLYQKFADAWRVTDSTSLFDYEPRTSTTTFTIAGWPPENPPCLAPEGPAAIPINVQTAQQICRAIVDKNRNENCVFDVAITGEAGFAELYLLSQRIEVGATRTTVNEVNDTARLQELGTFVATVMRRALSPGSIPTGAVQFTVNGANVGRPVRVNERGQATFRTSRQLAPGDYQVAARYIPATNSGFLGSTSFDAPHFVGGAR